jgi:L-asparaginase/Glu-tRNA(Gln) amidotransferase subunit D
MYEAIKKTIKQGIVVVISTRVPNGRVLPIYGNEGGGKTLKDAGAVFADNLSAKGEDLTYAGSSEHIRCWRNPATI